jgi:hypothetical protein
MPVVIAIGIFINIILAIVYEPLLTQNNGQPVDYATAIELVLQILKLGT